MDLSERRTASALNLQPWASVIHDMFLSWRIDSNGLERSYHCPDWPLLAYKTDSAFASEDWLLSRVDGSCPEVQWSRPKLEAPGAQLWKTRPCTGKDQHIQRHILSSSNHSWDGCFQVWKSDWCLQAKEIEVKSCSLTVNDENENFV